MSSAAARRLSHPQPRFRLRVERDPKGRLAVVVLQHRLRHLGRATELDFEPVARAMGLPLQVAMPLLAAAVRANGAAPSRLSRPHEDGDPPIELDEASGARVALALVAVRPLRKLERMEGVVHGIAEMSAEEALYWFARVMRGPKARTLRALRILLAKE